MKRLPIPVLPAVLALALAALPGRPAQAITFGEPDTKNRFPNVGAIVVTEGPGSPRIIGSGVLIHPRVLLTAGHVTAAGEALLEQGVPVFEISRISFGTDAFDPTTWVEAVAFVTHPGFEERPDTPDTQDVGVIILKEPVDLPCAKVGYEGLLDDLKKAGRLVNKGTPTKFLAVGYGRTLDFPPPEEEPADGLRRFSFPEYHALMDGWLYLNQNPATDNGGVAPGDSGGPIFWRDPDGNLVLVAITSRSPAWESISLAYRIDTAQALGFMALVVEMVEEGSFD